MTVKSATFFVCVSSLFFIAEAKADGGESLMRNDARTNVVPSRLAAAKASEGEGVSETSESKFENIKGAQELTNRPDDFKNAAAEASAEVAAEAGAEAGAEVFKKDANENPGSQRGNELPFKYVGNSFSLKFHRPSCLFAKCIAANHAVFFTQRHLAVDSGYAPCRWCLPPNWKTVHLIVLPPQKPSEEPNSKR